MSGKNRPGAAASEETAETPQLAIAAGRPLPKLLFVTSRDLLADNIGPVETAEVLQALCDRSVPVYDQAPRDVRDAATVMQQVRPLLQQHKDLEGVILIGGYDVIPSQAVDVLSPSLRQRLGATSDPDKFVVWCDDIYGDADGDGLPDLPVSRIPDGKSASLVRAALNAGNTPLQPPRSGVRNMLRPFADGVFELLPDDGKMMTSGPIRYDLIPPSGLTSEYVYLMLHGSHTNGNSFWGEDGNGGFVEAVTTVNIPPQSGHIIFSGCCWGALTVDTIAAMAASGQPVAQRAPEASIALQALALGARAFVGCTGSHYSPVQPPYDYFGGPLHLSFWRNIGMGMPPARALFEARKEYIAAVPHGRTEALSEAIERKIWREYTCLGLGW